MSRDFSRRTKAGQERWLRWDWRNLSLPRLRVVAWDDSVVAAYFDVALVGCDEALSVGASFRVPVWVWERIVRHERKRYLR